MVFPSGDHAGERSMILGVFVITRTSPFSAGTVMISPRAANTARAAFGDKWAFVSRALTFTMRSRTSGRSPAMFTGTAFTFPDLISNIDNPPNCSMTIPSGQAPTDFKSSPLFFTSSFTFCEPVRRAAVEIHAVQLRDIHVAFAVGSEEDLFSIRGPAQNDVGGRMPSQALRHATCGGHRVNIDIPVVFAREREGRTIG